MMAYKVKFSFAVFFVFCLFMVTGTLQLKKPKGLTKSEVLRRLRYITTIQEFEKAFNVKVDDGPIIKRGSLFSNLIQSIPQAGKPPDCKPRLDCYAIPHDPLVEQYVPECLNVTQCGGCCSSALKNSHMECVADKSETKPIMVVYVDKLSGTFSQKIIQYTNELSCQCQCKIQPEDCKPNQRYDTNHCQCICDSSDTVCPPKMTWSTTLCGCQCQISQQCASTHVWNTNTCQCDCKIRACANGEIFNSLLCQCLKTTNQVVLQDN